MPVAIGRVLDTRAGYGARRGRVGAGGQIALRVRGADAVDPSRPDIVPNSSAVTAVALSLTAVGPTANSSITVFRPNASAVVPAMALEAGRSATNTIVVPVGSDGTIRFRNSAGAVDLVGDVVGYFVSGRPATTRAGRTMPLSTPFTAVDTRLPPAVGRLGSRTQDTWVFTPFINSVRASGGAVGRQLGAWASLGAANLGASYVTAPASTYLTVYGYVAYPRTNELSLTRGDSTRNTILMAYGGGDRVGVYNSAGFVDYNLDITAVILGD